MSLVLVKSNWSLLGETSGSRVVLGKALLTLHSFRRTLAQDVRFL